MRRVKSIFILVVALSNVALAQSTFSPYSIRGIGDRQSKALSHQAGMGGVGIGTPSLWHINSVNPALLTYNKLTTFEFGVNGESRGIADEESSIRVGSGGFNYLNFAFPIISGKWTSHVGLMPYSTVNANFQGGAKEFENKPGDFSIEDTEFTGGINTLNFSNGFKVTKSLSIGVRASLLFGSTNSTIETTIEREGATLGIPTLFLRDTNYSGKNFGFGASYDFNINESQGMTFGVTYDLASDLEGTRTTTYERLTSVSDLTSLEEVKDVYSIPEEIGFGLSWQKRNLLTIGLDVVHTKWDKNAGFATDSEEYRETWNVGLGLELTPKYDDIDSYLNRVKYRLGFNYEQNPNVIEGKTFNDVGMTFGAAFPVRGISAVNLSCKLGRRGDLGNGLVRENYTKLVFGATINDRWFVRRKYN